MKDQSLFDVFSDFIAEGKLSRSKTAFLKTVYDQFYESGDSISPDSAGHLITSSLDLPPSYTIQCVASLLDHLRPNKDHRHFRLVETTDYLVDCGVIDQEQAEQYLEKAL